MSSFILPGPDLNGAVVPRRRAIKGALIRPKVADIGRLHIGSISFTVKLSITGNGNDC
jgi:hypothetical protein